MDEAQILELIDKKLGERDAELLNQIDRKNAGTAASIQRGLEKSLTELKQSISPQTQAEPDQQAEKPTGRVTAKDVDLEMKALKTDLQKLTAELEQERQQKLLSDRNAHLTSLISGAGVIPATQNAVKDIISARYGNQMKQENGKWYVETGDGVLPIDAIVSDYLKSPEGLAFLPASGTQGAGSKESGKTAAAANPGNMTAGQMLIAAFNESAES